MIWFLRGYGAIPLLAAMSLVLPKHWDTARHRTDWSEIGPLYPFRFWWLGALFGFYIGELPAVSTFFALR